TGGSGAMRSHPRLVLSALLLVVALALSVGAGATRTGFPGKNGRVVFNDRSGSLVLVNTDGTGLVRLARTFTNDTYIGAAWSPDGKEIAYSGRGPRRPDVRVVGTCGSPARSPTTRTSGRRGPRTARRSPTPASRATTPTSSPSRPMGAT